MRLTNQYYLACQICLSEIITNGCFGNVLFLQVDLSKSYIDLGIYSYIGRGKVKLHCGEAATATHGRTDRKAGS